MNTDGKAKHTPGPWYVEVGNDPAAWANYFPKVVTEKYVVVGTEGMYGDRETDLANARLIAAAPDQHAALQATQLLLERLGLESSDEYQRNATAIAKALGGAA